MLNNLYGEGHFEQIVEHLRADAGLDCRLFYRPGIEDFCIMLYFSSSSPFDLYFDMLDEYWGAEVVP